MSYDDPQGPARSVSPSLWPLFGSLLLLAAVAAGVAWFLGFLGERRGALNDPDAAPRPVLARGELAADESSTIGLFKAVSPTVVHITTLQYDRFSLDTEGVPAGTGSGFIWDKDGFVVTNAHVVQNADAARVTLNDGTTLEARKTGYAADYDLAVLKVNARGRALPEIQIGKSSDLQVGQKVFAIGNPFGLDQTLTTGIISALGRQIRSLTNKRIEGAIQTDAAINPGNSGGPLLDSAGRLIGVNTQIISPSGAYAGIGFAIPVDTVNQVVPELIQRGRVVRPRMGVELFEDAIARRLGVESGALIVRVVPNSPAAEAGLRPCREKLNGRLILGDIITRMDDDKVSGRDDVTRLLNKRKVGDTVRLGLLRNGEEVEAEVTLGEG